MADSRRIRPSSSILRGEPVSRLSDVNRRVLFDVSRLLERKKLEHPVSGTTTFSEISVGNLLGDRAIFSQMAAASGLFNTASIGQGFFTNTATASGLFTFVNASNLTAGVATITTLGAQNVSVSSLLHAISAQLAGLVAGTLTVTGATTLQQSLNALGPATLQGNYNSPSGLVTTLTAGTLNAGTATVTSTLEVDGTAQFDGTLDHNGSLIGLYGASPVAQAAAIGDVDGSTIDTTYGAEEAAVLADLRSKVNSLRNALRSIGILAT